MPADLAPWQRRGLAHALAALQAGRLGHGLLICGPAGLGAQEVASRLAEHILCADADDAERTRHRALIAAGSHPDLHRISLIPNKEGSKLRTEIVIEQIRDLTQKFGLTPQYGAAQVAIIDPADAINNAACNALLKTLEEPVPGRYLWLISTRPSRLPATIRSRCQRLEFRLPPWDEALAWLIDAQGHAPDIASEALQAARGHPGLADEWLRSDGWALRKEVMADLDKLGAAKTDPIQMAQRWSGDEQLAQRLSCAADWALSQATGADALKDPAQLRRLADWFDKANRTRDLLRTTVRADLLVVELLSSWRDGAQAIRLGAAK
ncbi:MAG: DNA polymerase III subunit delta' [Xanthomonadaceae bacterium]|jgi:DNA polymerase-3 subunit delta'|nr:DNA polymerase III subunit delta' [Xanthomonadaceae bacterium]